MRLLKKFVRKLYHLIWFLSLFVLFFIPNVKANEAVIDVTNEGQIGQWQVPLATQCFNSSYNSVTTVFEPGYLEVGGAYAKDYYSCSLGSSGLISITTNQLLADGKLYSLVLFVGNSSSNQPNYPSLVGVGDSTYTARNDISYSLNKSTLWSSRVSNRLDLEQTGDSSLVTLHYYAVYIIFSIKTNGTSVAVNITYPETQSSNTWLFGYELNYIGNTDGLKKSDVESALRNSGFATASSVQEVQQSVTQVQEEVSDINDTLIDDNVDGANSQVDDLLDNSNFDDSSGIQSIINAPLNFINSLSNVCSPINVTIPYIDEPLQIPCIKQELNNHIPLIVPILSTAINGFIIYRILLDLVRIIKNSRNPDDDRIEVLDL